MLTSPYYTLDVFLELRLPGKSQYCLPIMLCRLLETKKCSCKHLDLLPTLNHDLLRSCDTDTCSEDALLSALRKSSYKNCPLKCVYLNHLTRFEAQEAG